MVLKCLICKSTMHLCKFFISLVFRGYFGIWEYEAGMPTLMILPVNQTYIFCVSFPGLSLQPKEGFAYLNLCYADNADYILSCLIHQLASAELKPFPRNLSNQFDNASNNKCNEAVGFFAYLISEEIFHNVSCYLSSRPQVSMVYRLINYAGCWQNT